MNRFPNRARIHFGVNVSLVSALGIGWPSQRFQNPEAPPDISKALRLPSRAQNKAMEALTTVTVEIRGSGLRSVIKAMRRSENRNTLSEYAIKRRRMSGLPFSKTLPFQFGHLFHEALHLLIVANGLAHAVPPGEGNAYLAQFAGLALHQVQRLV